MASGIYRNNFSKLAPICLVPSILIASFLIFTFLYILPRSTETGFKSNLLLQVIEFGVILAGGTTLSFLVAMLGFARILSVTSTLVHRELAGHEIPSEQLEAEASKHQIGILPSILHAWLYAFSWILLGLLPLLVGGVWSAFAPPNAAGPALLGVLAFLTIPIGCLLACYRASIGLTIASVVIHEKLPTRQALKRTKALMTPRKFEMQGNVLASATFHTICLFLAVAVLGANLLALLGPSKMLGFLSQSSMIRAVAELMLSLLPTVLATWLTVPYLCTLSACAYWQRRVVSEGYDIRLMHESLPEARR